MKKENTRYAKFYEVLDFLIFSNTRDLVYTATINSVGSVFSVSMPCDKTLSIVEMSFSCVTD